MPSKNTYKSYETMSTPEKMKMMEAHAAESCDSESCDSMDAPIERGSRLKSHGFFGYPPYMALLLLMELCERFSFYGIRSVLAVYFTQQLGYTQSESTKIYHAYIVACYITPIIGGIIADQYWGKYKTILLLSIVYAAGNGVVSFASTLPQGSEGGSAQILFTFLGLGLVALGTGGIKPCVSAFCGDQLDPNDKVRRERFFTIFYACINLGAIVSSYLTPSLRQTSCMGKESCYPMAFGVPSILMFVALALFIAGSKLYIRNKVRSNVCTKFIKTVAGVNPNASRDFKRESARMIKIFKIILPMSIFWAVFDQAGSTFTYQAAQLDKSIIKPLRSILFMPSGWLLEDQIEAMNPIILLTLIPVFNVIIYPLISTVYKMTALRKMTLGLAINCLVCVFAGWLQLKIDQDFTYVMPEYNHNSKIANATFVFQVQYKQHYSGDEEHKNKWAEEQAHVNLHLRNMDLYDSDMFERPKNATIVANQLIRNNGVASPRYWSWHGDIERQRESITNPEDFQSRLSDKLSCSKAWRADLPHIEYTGHDRIDYASTKQERDVDADASRVFYNLPAGSFTKILIYPNGHMFPVDVPVERPKQGRSNLYFYTRQENVGTMCKHHGESFYKNRLFCKNDNDYSFEREEKYIPCIATDESSAELKKLTFEQNKTETDFTYSRCEIEGGEKGAERSKIAHIGYPAEKYEARADNLWFPEHHVGEVLPWAEGLTTEKRAAAKLYRTTFRIPLKSKCWYFKDRQNYSMQTTADFLEKGEEMDIGVNGIYSKVDFTNPTAEDYQPGETDFSPIVTDMQPLQYSVLWQMLLYFLSTSAEILISISGLEYSYAQAPKSMKAVASSLWLLPVTIGNVYVMYVSSFYYFKTHAYKIHRFNTVVAAFITVLYMWIASNYVTSEEEEEQEKERLKKEGELDESKADEFLFGEKH